MLKTERKRKEGNMFYRLKMEKGNIEYGEGRKQRMINTKPSIILCGNGLNPIVKANQRFFRLENKTRINKI